MPSRHNPPWRTRYLGFALVAAAFLAGCANESNTNIMDVDPQFGTPGVDPLNVDLRPSAEYGGPGSPVDWGYPQTAEWEFPVAFNVGTGRIDPFLTIQADPREYGFNTDGNWNKQLYDMTRPQFVDAITVAGIPTIVENDVRLKEIIFDANESNSDLTDAQFAINTFNLWACDTGDDAPATYTDPAQFRSNTDCDLIYFVNEGAEIDRAKASDAATSGSGQALDYRIKFPESIFPDADNGCEYSPTGSSCTTYIIAELDLGDETTSDWETGATFEELSVVKRPKLEIEKTANATFTRTYHWIVEKEADPAIHYLSPGETSPTTTYTITAKLDPGDPYTDSDFVLSGVITISNPSTPGGGGWNQPAIIDDIWDILPDGTRLDFEDLACEDDQGAIALPYLIGGGDVVTCTYSVPFEGGTTNTAWVDYSDPEDPDTDLLDDSFEATVVYATEPSIEVNASVNVYDEYQGSDDPDGTPVFLGVASVDDPPPTSFTRERTWTFTPDLTQCGAFDNEATIYYVNDGVETELADQDVAQVIVNCTELTVTKTVNERIRKTWNWTLTKNVNPGSWALFDGESAVSDYEVIVDKVDFDYDGWRVWGVITVENTGNIDVTVADVSDVVSNGGPDFDATVSGCSPALGSVLAPGETMTCDYTTADGLTSGDYDTNVATATDGDDGAWDSDPYPVSFAEADVEEFIEVDASVTVYDAFDGGGDVELGQLTDDDTFEYPRTFACGEDHTYNNTASVYGDDTGDLLDSDDASVAVTCYDLDITKDVLAQFDRNWTWEVEKDFTDAFITGTTDLECTEPDSDGDRVCTATVQEGANVTVEYQVMVTATGTESNFEVLSGPSGIVITNNHPDRQADLTEVTDVVSTMGAATVICPSYVVPAGGTLTCTYSTAMVGTDPGDGTNTATAMQQLYDFASDGTPTADGTTPYSTDPVLFSFVLDEETNECANTVDILAGYTDEDFPPVCATDPDLEESWTFDAYDRTFGPDQCDQTHINTATVTPNDGGPIDQDQETFILECEQGCTLTQGFYKTHSEFGPAPYSTLWETPITPQEGDTPFFGTGYSWYEMFQLSPQGGNPYIKLAHQWMAAKLNWYWNGGAPAAVESALTQGEALLIAYQAAVDIDKQSADGQLANDLASTLASYNEGDIGPGHCTENTIPFLLSIFGS